MIVVPKLPPILSQLDAQGKPTGEEIGRVEIKTSKDKKEKYYTYYKYAFSISEPAGTFWIREFTDENGQKFYMKSFIDNISGYATN